MTDKQLQNFKKQIKESINLHYNGPEDQKKVVVNIMADSILNIMFNAYAEGHRNGINYTTKTASALITDLLKNGNAFR